MVSPERVELSSLAPEASTLSVELRGHALQLAREGYHAGGEGNKPTRWRDRLHYSLSLQLSQQQAVKMSDWFWIGPTLAALLTLLGYILLKYWQGEFNQAISIEYRHQRVSISPSQTLFFVEVEARNASKVPVSVRFMEVALSRLSRYTDEEALELYRQSFPRDGSPLEEIPWELIFTIRRKWEEGTLTIQPGEVHFESGVRQIFGECLVGPRCRPSL